MKHSKGGQSTNRPRRGILKQQKPKAARRLPLPKVENHLRNKLSVEKALRGPKSWLTDDMLSPTFASNFKNLSINETQRVQLFRGSDSRLAAGYRSMTQEDETVSDVIDTFGGDAMRATSDVFGTFRERSLSEPCLSIILPLIRRSRRMNFREYHGVKGVKRFSFSELPKQVVEVEYIYPKKNRSDHFFSGPKLYYSISSTEGSLSEIEHAEIDQEQPVVVESDPTHLDWTAPFNFEAFLPVDAKESEDVAETHLVDTTAGCKFALDASHVCGEACSTKSHWSVRLEKCENGDVFKISFSNPFSNVASDKMGENKGKNRAGASITRIITDSTKMIDFEELTHIGTDQRHAGAGVVRRVRVAAAAASAPGHQNQYEVRELQKTFFVNQKLVSAKGTVISGTLEVSVRKQPIVEASSDLSKQLAKPATKMMWVKNTVEVNILYDPEKSSDYYSAIDLPAPGNRHSLHRFESKGCQTDSCDSVFPVLSLNTLLHQLQRFECSTDGGSKYTLVRHFEGMPSESIGLSYSFGNRAIRETLPTDANDVSYRARKLKHQPERTKTPDDVNSSVFDSDI